jgi:archaellum biogenesis ATPase FlaH
MSKQSTGFQAIDGKIGGGVPIPFCLSVCSYRKNASLTYELLWRVMHRYLEDGMDGFYICLNSPEKELRKRLKDLNISIDENEGELLFLDFFSSRAKKIEKHRLSDLQLLAYDAQEIMDEVVSRLDEVGSRGFMIIDSVSTLISNVDVERAYLLVQGFKMLTRERDMIGMGISFKDPIEERTLEMLRSNADGCFDLENNDLDISGFGKSSEGGDNLSVTKTEGGLRISSQRYMKV